VAGTIAAVGNNARNVAGLNWQVKIMAVKSFCRDGTGNTGDIIAGIYYAVNGGATIINNSWSIGDVNHQLLRAAIEYANLNHVLFVSAAGNERNDNDAIPQYPASYPLDNVMAVAATSETDQLWIDQFSTQRGSNWGTTSVHIAAPGEGIFSLYPVYLGCVTNPPDPDCAIAGGDGTSMAAPHVAGCAALLQANRSAASLPALLPKDLKTRLMAAGDEVNSLNGKVVDARRLNCKSAIYPDIAPPEAPINLKIQ
jgi:subtilisin family serine protease